MSMITLPVYFACQVNFLAHPGTTGAAYVDHIVADRVVAPPDHALFFSESILLMSHHYQVRCFRVYTHTCTHTDTHIHIPKPEV